MFQATLPRSLVVGFTLAILVGASVAEGQRRGPRGQRGERAAQRDQSEGGAKKDESTVKPYDEVITDDVKTTPGLFLVHREGENVYFEIPTSELGADMLWVTQVAETTAGSSYPGMPAGDRVIRWEQRGDSILFRDVRYNVRADTDDPIARAVEQSNIAPIIKVFPIKAYGKDKAPVIDVTDLFRSDVPELSAQRTLGAGRMDTKRSFVEEIKAFPTNIETRVLATYAASGENNRSSGITAMIHHSMVQLPKDPMTPRRHDERVGYFSVGFTDFADDSNHEAERVRYITRWRLEKKDPSAEISDPVKPIVFYVGRNVPEKWKPYLKAGIDQWQPAFEAAGFSNAIIGKYAPDQREDPAWDAEDARISTIRWLPADIANAFGPHVHDPRTGEILEADVRMYHNVQKLVRDWYFAQAAAVDERAQQLPLPDELMGELIQFVVAHEVGHSLGFPHNFKASSAYSIEQLRDPEWTKANGTAPSIMDYARFNYVAQPGDGAALLPAIGPYDHFATEWGYRQFDRGVDEKAELEAIVARQIDEPMYRFGGGGDPTAQTEDLSGDAIEATALGLANLERIAALLVSATCKPGEDYDLLENMYGALLGQWNREMGHVTNVVGGVEEINLFYGDADQRYFMLEADYQRQAVQFLVDNALGTPTAMMPNDVILRLTPNGVADRVLSAQQRIVRQLVNDRRVNRMAEHAELGGSNPYMPSEMLTDLRNGMFSEFEGSLVDVDLYRRNLQRAYVEHLASQLDDPAVDSDLPALSRMELLEIAKLLTERFDRSASDDVSAHMIDLGSRIKAALEPRREKAGGNAGSAPAQPQRRRRPGSRLLPALRGAPLIRHRGVMSGMPDVDEGPMTTGLGMEPASSFDIGKLARIVTDAFREYFVEIRADDASLSRMIRSDGVDLHASRVIERDGAAIGAILVALRGWAARIVAMGVVPEARGAGAGTWALRGLLEDLDARGVRETWLEVIEANTAGVRLYEGNGFERVRRLVGFTADAETARAIAELDEGLAEIDMRAVGTAMAAGGDADLPWQVSGESLAQGVPPSRGYELGEAMCVISDPAQERVAFTGIVVAPDERRCGEATRLVRAVLAAHPDRAWRVPEIMPERLAGLFDGVGLARSGIAQLQLRRPILG